MYNCQSNRITKSDIPLFPGLELHKLIHTDSVIEPSSEAADLGKVIKFCFCPFTF